MQQPEVPNVVVQLTDETGMKPETEVKTKKAGKREPTKSSLTSGPKKAGAGGNNRSGAAGGRNSSMSNVSKRSNVSFSNIRK